MAEKIKPWKTKMTMTAQWRLKEKQAKDEGHRNRHTPDMHAMTQGNGPRKQIEKL